MNTNINELTNSLNSQNGWHINVDNVIKASNSSNATKKPLMLRILSIFGGLFGAILFAVAINLIFQFSSLSNFIIGVMMFSSGVYVFQKIDDIILDTMGLVFIIIGLGLFGYGLNVNLQSDTLLAVIYLGVGFGLMFWVDAIIVAFLGTSLALGSLGYLLLVDGDTFSCTLYSTLLTITIFYFIMLEGKWLSQFSQHTQKFNAVLLALMIAFFIGIYFTKHNYDVQIWPLGVAPYLAILYFIHAQKLQNTWFYTASVLLVPLVGAPGIIASICIMILSFHIQHKLALILSIISLLFFINSFYYNLQLTLLTKSIVLMVSGIMMLLVYWVVRKNESKIANS